MKHYFIGLTTYSPKNKAHQELQKFVTPYKGTLTDAKERVLIKSAIKQKIQEVNDDHSRCHNIQLSGWIYENETIAVDGNFILTFKEVEDYQLSEDIKS